MEVMVWLRTPFSDSVEVPATVVAPVVPGLRLTAPPTDRIAVFIVSVPPPPALAAVRLLITAMFVESEAPCWRVRL